MAKDNKKEQKPEAADALTPEELQAKIAELENANQKLTDDLDDALTRLSVSEAAEKTREVTVIKTKKHGKVAFYGKGLNYGGTVYTSEELKKLPEIIEALVDIDSGRVKKQ